MMNSVLRSIPIYFMSSFLLPKWIINRLDKIQKRFLWGQSETSKGIFLINWPAACLPKQNGGMGGANLLIRNWSLLLRWWWRLYQHPNSLWSRTVVLLRCLTSSPNTHKVWIAQGSFFWNQLLKIKHLFDWSTRWSIGTGSSISFWFDAWTFPIMASLSSPLPSNRTWSLQRTIANGLHSTDSISVGALDQILWQWTSNGEYSAKSFYDMIVATVRTKWRFEFTWHLKIPPSVRVFVFLCLRGKLLTHDVMD